MMEGWYILEDGVHLAQVRSCDFGLQGCRGDGHLHRIPLARRLSGFCNRLQLGSGLDLSKEVAATVARTQFLWCWRIGLRYLEKGATR